MMLGALLSAIFALQAHAEIAPANWKPIPLEKWGGIDVLHDSTHISPEDSPNATNVLTDSGYLEKRPGNVRLATVLNGFPVLALGEWVAPSGTRYLIAQASTTVYQTDFSGAFVKLSTVPSAYHITMIPAFSRLYFADGYNHLWYWDEASTGTVTSSAGTSAPDCTYIDYKDTRIYCANIASEGTSRVRLSSAGGAGYYVVPSDVAFVDDAPNVFDFTPNDGDYITCMKATPWGMFIGKRFSSYMVHGNGNLSYDLRTLDPKVGCTDNRSVQMVYGILQWLGYDGVYGYNGSGVPQLISRELDPVIKQVRQGQAAEVQWVTTLRSNWSTGVSSPTASWDYDTLPGGIFPSSFTLLAEYENAYDTGTLVDLSTINPPGYITLSSNVVQADFSSGTYASNPPWTVTAGTFDIYGGGLRGTGYVSGLGYDWLINSAYTPSTISSGSWTFKHLFHDGYSGYSNACNVTGVNCFEFQFEKNAGGDFYALRLGEAGTYSAKLVKKVAGAETELNSATVTYVGDTWYTWKIERSSTGLTEVYLDGVAVTSATDVAISSSVRMDIWLTSAYTIPSNQLVWGRFDDLYAFSFSSTGTWTSPVFDSGFKTTIGHPVSSTQTLTADGKTAIAWDLRQSSSTTGVWTAYESVDGAAPSNHLRYWQLRGSFSTTVPTETPKAQAFSISGNTTGYYLSQVKYIGTQNVGWKQFNVTEANPGWYNYWVRAATWVFVSSETAPSWTAQTANTNISVATGSYAQFRIDSASVTVSSSTEVVDAIILRYINGSNIPVASAVLDRRYYLCVTISTTATTPDTCLVRQKTGKWVYWTGPLVTAMGVYSDNVTAGDGSANSHIWKIMQAGIYSDDGAAIDASWQTSDFTDGLVFNNKILHEIWVDALPVSLSSVTVSYMVNKTPPWNANSPFGTFYLDNGQGIDPSFHPINGQYGSLNKWIQLNSGYEVGKYFRLKFSDATVDSYFRINSALLWVEDEPRQVP